MARTNTIDRYFTPIRKGDSVRHTDNEGTVEQNKECPFLLRLPVEVRIMIWRYALDGDITWTNLHYPETITRLNRQLRFETLPIVYENPYQVSIHGETPADWVESVEEVIDDFSGKSAAPGFSLLHHLSGLCLEATAKHPTRRRLLKICFYLTNDREEMMDFSEQEAEEYKIERVVIGQPGMNWTDVKAVRAACDEAAIRLERNRRRLFAEAEEAEREELRENPHLMTAEHVLGVYLPLSYTGHFRAALDAVCVLVSVCPRLTNVVVLDKLDAD